MYLCTWQPRKNHHQRAQSPSTKQNPKYADQAFMLKLKQVNQKTQKIIKSYQ